MHLSRLHPLQQTASQYSFILPCSIYSGANDHCGSPITNGDTTTGITLFSARHAGICDCNSTHQKRICTILHRKALCESVLTVLDLAEEAWEVVIHMLVLTVLDLAEEAWEVVIHMLVLTVLDLAEEAWEVVIHMLYSIEKWRFHQKEGL